MSRKRVEDSSVPPYAAICLIEMYRVTHDGTPVSFVNRSTGFLVAPHVLVTAGHSLSENESRIQRIELYPHQNAHEKTDQRLVVEAPGFVIRKVPEYNNPYCYVKDDFGVIILQSDTLPDWTSQHFRWQPDYYRHHLPVAGQPIQIAGYPIDQPDFELWEEAGPVIETTDRCLLHPFITTKRNSGSPIWTMENGIARLVALHVSGNAASCGARPENRPYGSAVLLTSRVATMIEEWIQEESQPIGTAVRLAL